MTNGGFNEGKGIYTSEDFRFTQKGKRVDVLGKGKAKYVCDALSLRVPLPAGTWPIPVIRVTLR